MPDVRVNPQQIDADGIAIAFAGSLSTSDTYLVSNDGRVILHFKKSAAVVCTVTVDTPGSVGGLAVAQRTITVPASTGDIEAGPFPPDLYNQPGANDLEFTLSDIDGLTVAAKRL